METSYRMYVTNSLQAIPQYKYLTTRWSDTIRTKKPQIKKSADEIAFETIAKCGLKFRSNEGGEK